MSNIGNVDYMAIPAKADQMRECGRGVCNEMYAMYNTIREMHADWYGVRYNALVEEFNKIRPNINLMLNLVFTDLPDSLYAVANNYSRVDRQTIIREVSVEKPQLIEDLPIVDDNGKLRFNRNRVAERRQAVAVNIKKATELIDEFEKVYRTIEWESEAATVYTKTFTNLKEQLMTSFNDLRKQFAELMLQTEQDFEQVEKANTVQ
ncbi:MAG: hypothetical protein J6A29_02400 [Clostridia bacterium]|nr:hypothetical protein [Clostridia bacterium]